MLDDTRPGTVYWIDHYTVGTNDLDRWSAFHERVLGARTVAPAPGGRARDIFQDLTNSHHGGFIQTDPMPPSDGVGKGLPRHGLFIWPEDVDEHLRRLDVCGAPHSDAIWTSAEGEDGTAIYWEDLDGNQFEFWAPARMPAGGMDDCGPLRIGRVSHGVYESRDLQRTADFFSRYCALEPLVNSDVPSDTLVLPLAAGGRMVFKQVEVLGPRTSGHGVYRGLHAALVVREEDFWSSYERIWAELPEWDYDERQGKFSGDAEGLSARTVLHGSPAGRAWKDSFDRGDDWLDPDNNLFHFFVGVPRHGSMATYAGHSIEDYMQAYLEARGLKAATPIHSR